MRSTQYLIEENNEKRKLLNVENESLYEDFLLYIRTDLRVSEQDSEELLMDILDHLIEGQKEGKTATDLFGTQPQLYADELIAMLPSENKKNVFTFVSSQVINSLGGFSIIFGLLNLVLPLFIDIERTVPFGNITLILIAVLILAGFSVFFIFKIIRSSLFTADKRKSRWAIWKAGFLGAGSFALIMCLAWLLPDFGPAVNFEWWIYLVIGAVLIIIGKLVNRKTS